MTGLLHIEICFLYNDGWLAVVDVHIKADFIAAASSS